MHYFSNSTGPGHEQLRREIEQQVSEFLAGGGKIDCLVSPRLEPNRHVQVRGNLVVDQ
tara:strand:- start:151 stop:324 length:174 start_codon:yes stop_codon:yes gene_type:complete